MVSLMKHIPGHPTEDHFDIICMMVDEEEKPDFSAVDQRSGKTAFMMAVETKDARVVKLILEEVGAEGARLLANVQNRAGNSAVHLAAGLREGEGEEGVKKQILKTLIMWGGDTSLLNKEKESPNDWAGKLIREIQSELT
ncbi:uncharacterized protein LOC143291663 [Babylonia areolata]|uniref:uncharacterized protein LOC143291663 n=1 Tax=Babylonia areolata TaxID=304850 RepID=UPI003FD3BB4B